MPKILNVRLLLMFFVIVIFSGCSSNQTLKDAWKNTRTSWYTHASPKASIDYDDAGDLSPNQVALSTKMIGIDVQLIKLERIMQNGDKSPTGEWISKLFESVPWITGFAGVRANGEILGQEPAGTMENYDFSPLLEVDEKQPMRALRSIVVASDSNLPEILLATPLYESSDFLGIVVTSFNMNSLLSYSSNADGIIIFTPQTILWSGNYAQAASSLLNLDWENIAKNDVTGNITLGSGSYSWVVRFLGNLPIIFAVPYSENLPINQDVMDAEKSDSMEDEKNEVMESEIDDAMEADKSDAMEADKSDAMEADKNTEQSTDTQ